MLVLLITWLLIQLIGAIRGREPLTMILAVLGIVLWLLHCLNVVNLPPCLAG